MPATRSPRLELPLSASGRSAARRGAHPALPAILAVLLLGAGSGSALAQEGAPPGTDPQQGDQEPEGGMRPGEVELPLPKAIVLPRGEAEITIDGVLQDWPASPALALDDIRQVSGTALGAFLGRDDVRGQAFLLWDTEALHVACVVQDDWHRPLTHEHRAIAELPPADALVLTIDPARDTRAMGPDTGRSDDVGFWLGEVGGRKLILWDRYRGTARFTEGAEFAVRRDEDLRLTSYEARIPWAEILPAGRKVEAGTVLDLQLVIQDFDEATDPVPQTRVGWTFGSRRIIDPAGFGSVMLVQAVDREFGRFPKFPERAEPEGEAVPPPAWWVKVADRLVANPPQPFEGGELPPGDHAGSARVSALADLEQQLAAQPRVDVLEFNLRVHRRMNREVAGYLQGGLPFFWQHRLEQMVEELAAAPPESGFRLFRLPQGGWIVRSRTATFAVDPTGANLPQIVGGAIDFVLLTQPLSVLRRNDQLLVRMFHQEEPRIVYTHVPFHLPTVPAAAMYAARPGKSYDNRGVTLTPLAATEGEELPISMSWRVDFPDGASLVFGSPQLDEALLQGEEPVDALVLSAMHPRVQVVGQRVRAGLTILDDLFSTPINATADPRVPVGKGREFQRALLPNRSLILAPGESWTVPGPD